MIFRFVLATLAVFTLPCSSSWAAPINQVSPGLITGLGFTTFEDVAGGDEPGTNYDTILRSGNASFAERFAGETNTPTLIFGPPPPDPDARIHDILSRVPSAPLSLAPGPPNQNLAVLRPFSFTQVLSGVGVKGFPQFDALFEGSFAVLFDSDQSQLSFDLVGGSPFNGSSGAAFVSFYRRDGSLIDLIALPILSEVQSHGFVREGDVEDIAGFSLYNTDFGGIGIDNLRYELFAVPVPAPAVGLLLGTGVLPLAIRMRRWT